MRIAIRLPPQRVGPVRPSSAMAPVLDTTLGQKRPRTRGGAAGSPTSDDFVGCLVQQKVTARACIFLISWVLCTDSSTGRLAGFLRFEAGEG